jgi:hypothetical protein
MQGASDKIAALVSLLFAGVALFATEYNLASLLQFVLLPVAYWLPAIPQRNDPNKIVARITVGVCATQCLMFLACLLAKDNLGNDERGGVLSLVSIGLVADAMFHKRKKVTADPVEVGPVYVLL